MKKYLQEAHTNDRPSGKVEEDVLSKFKSKYGAGDVEKYYYYYPKRDVAVQVPLWRTNECDTPYDGFT